MSGSRAVVRRRAEVKLRAKASSQNASLRIHGCRPRAAGTIDQDVDLTERLCRLRGDPGDVAGNGYIAGDRRHVAMTLDLVDPPRRGRDARALCGQEVRDAGADAGACAGNQAGPAVEFEIHPP